MSLITCHVSISMDGFIAGPDQSLENPIGVGGLKIHQWHFGDGPTHEGDAAARDDLMRTVGAVIMGRNMYGPIRDEWDADWRGWWGDEPAVPLTSVRPHPLSARADRDGRRHHVPLRHGQIRGTSTRRRTPLLAATSASPAAPRQSDRRSPQVPSTRSHSTSLPVLLGSGERLFDGVDDPGFEPVEGDNLAGRDARPLPGSSRSEELEARPRNRFDVRRIGATAPSENRELRVAGAQNSIQTG